MPSEPTVKGLSHRACGRRSPSRRSGSGSRRGSHGRSVTRRGLSRPAVAGRTRPRGARLPVRANAGARCRRVPRHCRSSGGGRELREGRRSSRPGSCAGGARRRQGVVPGHPREDGGRLVRLESARKPTSNRAAVNAMSAAGIVQLVGAGNRAHGCSRHPVERDWLNPRSDRRIEAVTPRTLLVDPERGACHRELRVGRRLGLSLDSPHHVGDPLDARTCDFAHPFAHLSRRRRPHRTRRPWPSRARYRSAVPGLDAVARAMIWSIATGTSKRIGLGGAAARARSSRASRTACHCAHRRDDDDQRAAPRG